MPYLSILTTVIYLAATGKTMLLNTIAINILNQFEDVKLLFIDTKQDFSAIKLDRMMKCKGIYEEKQMSILKRILVRRIHTVEDLIAELKLIIDLPRQHDKLKIIMIDSVSVPFYFYLGHTSFGLSLMGEVVDQLKHLSRSRNIAVS